MRLRNFVLVVLATTFIPNLAVAQEKGYRYTGGKGVLQVTKSNAVDGGLTILIPPQYMQCISPYGGFAVPVAEMYCHVDPRTSKIKVDNVDADLQNLELLDGMDVAVIAKERFYGEGQGMYSLCESLQIYILGSH